MSSKERQHRKERGDREEDYYDRCQSTTDNSLMKRTHADGRKTGARHSSMNNQRKRKSRSLSLSPDRGRKRKRLTLSEKEQKRKKHRKSKKYKTHKKKQTKRSHEKLKQLSCSEVKKAKDSVVLDKSEDVGAAGKSQSHKGDDKIGKDENCYDVSDNDSELNLSKPMHRIIDYIDDKRELCHQTFKTLRGQKLQKMIPEILRGYSLTDLRDMCHSELNGMSKKRVLRILNGDEPEGISSSSSSSTGGNVASSQQDVESDSNSSSVSDSDVSKSNRSSSSSSSGSSTSRTTSSKYRSRREHHKSRSKVKKSSKKHIREKEKLSSTPEAVVDSTCKIEEPNMEETKLTEKDISNSGEPGAAKGDSEKEGFEDQDVLVVSATDLNQDLDQELTHRDPSTNDQEPTGNVDQSSIQVDRARRKEILELEMRARAIRSMINAQELKDPRLRLKKM